MGLKRVPKNRVMTKYLRSKLNPRSMMASKLLVKLDVTNRMLLSSNRQRKIKIPSTISSPHKTRDLAATETKPLRPSLRRSLEVKSLRSNLQSYRKSMKKQRKHSLNTIAQRKKIKSRLRKMIQKRKRVEIINKKINPERPMIKRAAVI